MDSGVAIAVLVIYFTLQYPANGTIGENTIQSWWGNTVYKNTLDAKAASYYQPDNVTFGYAQTLIPYTLLMLTSPICRPKHW